MNLWKTSAVLIALSLPLMAAKCDLQSAAVATCNALDSIYKHYDRIVTSVPVRYANYVTIVRAETDRACVSPSTMDTLELATIANNAYRALRNAFQASMGQGDADYDASQGLDKLEDLKASLQRLRKG